MSAQSQQASLVVPNQLKELDTITRFLDDLAEQWNLPVTLIMTLNLVLEEAFTNIVLYAYPDDQLHAIDFGFSRDGNLLRVELTDDGVAYDPTVKEDPDVGLSAGEREIGGLGIFLIKQMMDTVSYHRQDEKNHLVMEKSF